MSIGTMIVGGIITIILVPTLLNYGFKNIKDKREKEIEKIRYQKEILELEIERENAKIRLLEEENKKLDKLIYQGRE